MWKRLIMENKDYDAVKAPRIGFFESTDYLNKKTTDEQFVKDFCQKYSLKLETLRFDVPAEAEERGALEQVRRPPSGRTP